MNSTLKTLLPTTLPIATSVLPPSTAPIDTAISGELVPSATIVRPTTSGDRPSETASRDAPRTSNSAPTTSATSPARNQKKVIALPAPQAGGSGRRRR